MFSSEKLYPVYTFWSQFSRILILSTTKEVKKATFASAVNVEAEETEEFISDDDCMYVFKRTWYGYECKFSDFNSEYAEGDAINLTIKFNKEVQSQKLQNHLYLTMTT